RPKVCLCLSCFLTPSDQAPAGFAKGAQEAHALPHFSFSRLASKGGRGRRGSRARAAGARGCRLRSQLVPVRALGLGHRSDELVRFRFCSGSCRRARSPHDLSLARLLGAGALRPPPGARPVSQPCCRPTRYEAVSFMDVNSTWRTVERLSATACGCLG
uniref:Artemin n=1 Tax=Sus scrofa TaxID=9823 RepID=A0A4X1W8I3_PIG